MLMPKEVYEFVFHQSFKTSHRTKFKRSDFEWQKFEMPNTAIEKARVFVSGVIWTVRCVRQKKISPST
jgi:hypothetical protein